MVLGQVRAADRPSRRVRVLLVAVVVLASAFAILTASSAHVPTLDRATSSPVAASSAAPSSGSAGPEAAPRTVEPAADTALSSASTGSVVRTVFPGFNTSLPGSFTSSVSAWQVGTPTYVPITNTIWFPQRSISVPGYPVPTVAPAAVFNLSTGEFDEFATNVSNASALAYDPGNGYVYAALAASNAVTIVDPRSGVIVGPTIRVGLAPVALAFDANTNQLFVANSGSSNVTVIDAIYNTVSVGNVPVGSNPVSLATDPQDGLVFVANEGSKFVTVINTSHPTTLLYNISLFDGPASGLAFSPRTDMLIATIPSSRYATIIDASAETPLDALLAVGKGMVPAVTSANGTEFVLGNSTGGSVAVLNSTTGTTIQPEITVYQNATQLVLDPQTGLILCWTSNPRVVESVNLSTNHATPITSTDSPQLVSMTYLESPSRIYASATSGSLSYSLDATRLDQAAPVTGTSFPPLSVVVDSVGDRLYVGTTDGLDVYGVPSDALVGSVSGLSGNCSQLVLDRADNLLWLANSLRGAVAVDLATLNVVVSSGLIVSSTAAQGIALDPSDSEVFILTANGTVTVLGSVTGYLVTSGVRVGANVTSLVYDPADDQLYAAGDAVSLVAIPSNTIDGGPVLLGSPHKVLGEEYEPSREDVYVASVGLLPGKQGTVTVLDGSSVSASEASTVEIPVGENPDAFGVVSAGSGGGVASAMVWVANELSGTISVIASPPQITSFSASPSTVDLGFPTSILVAYQGGAGSSTIMYSGLPPGCSSSDESELNCTPTAQGVFLLAANLTDSLGISVNLTASLTVLRSLAVHTTFSLSTLPYIDVGVALGGAVSAVNGLFPYSYRWSFGDGSGASGPTASHAYASPGAYVVNAEVQDATGASNNSSVSVIVLARPSVAISLTPGNVTDVNVPVSFDATTTGGVGESQQAWTFGDGAEANGSTASHAWTGAGNYTVDFRYADALGATANTSVEVVVHPSLTATFSSGNVSSSNPSSPGTPVAFTSRVSGGTPPYVVTWWFGDGSMANGLSVNHPYASTGTYAVNVTLTDAAGGSVRTNLSVTIAPSSNTGGGITSPGSGFGAGLFLGLLIGGVIAGVVLFALGPRKGARSPGGPVSPYVPP